MQDFDKKQIARAVLQELEKKRLELLGHVESFRKSATESSKSIESWSDSSRTQFNMMAGAIQNEVRAIESAQALLTNLNNKAGVVGIGSLVLIGSNSLPGGGRYFFIVPEGAGGFSVKVGDGQILIIASTSPIGSVLVGKRIKEKAEFNGEKLEIISIG